MPMTAQPRAEGDGPQVVLVRHHEIELARPQAREAVLGVGFQHRYRDSSSCEFQRSAKAGESGANHHGMAGTTMVPLRACHRPSSAPFARGTKPRPPDTTR